jgi:hypothetical protein
MAHGPNEFDTGSGYDADGDGKVADNSYYAPGKYEFSLVCRLGNTWFQGGTSSEFVADADNYLVMQANDVVGTLGEEPLLRAAHCRIRVF